MPKHIQKKIKAIFRGANGSCGYEKNKEYSLLISQYLNGNIKIHPVNDGEDVDYESIYSFLENWDNIRVR